jgi:large conductance mechanosensitive channel
MKGFKQFLMRGNVVDLAIAVVIGAAFGTVISSFVKDLLTPLIAAIGGQQDFSAQYFTVNGSRFMYGNFINALLAFVFVSAAVYYFVVVPMNAYTRRTQPKTLSEEATTRKCPECLSDIPIQARRCAHCTSEVTSPNIARTG